MDINMAWVLFSCCLCCWFCFVAVTVLVVLLLLLLLLLLWAQKQVLKDHWLTAVLWQTS